MPEFEITKGIPQSAQTYIMSISNSDLIGNTIAKKQKYILSFKNALQIPEQ